MAHDATAPTHVRPTTIAMAGDTTKRSRSAVTVALLVLTSCRLALTFSSRASPPSPTTRDDNGDNPAARGVEPVGYLASISSSVLAAYVASAATRRDRRRRLSAGAVLAELRRTWARPVATAMYIELLTAAMVLLLRTVGELLAEIGAGENSAAAGLVAAFGSVALVGWLGTVLFAHSDIACRMSLVVAAVEEEKYEGAAAAVRRAEALVAGRAVRGGVIGLVAAAIEQAPAWLFGDDGVPVFVLAPAVFAAKIVACCVCAAFYYDCRRRHDRSGLKVEEMTKGCDISDESEAEEFGSAFRYFRLT